MCSVSTLSLLINIIIIIIIIIIDPDQGQRDGVRVRHHVVQGEGEQQVTRGHH